MAGFLIFWGSLMVKRLAVNEVSVGSIPTPRAFGTGIKPRLAVSAEG